MASKPGRANFGVKSCGKNHAFCNICRKPRSAFMMLVTPPKTGVCSVCGADTVVITAKHCRPCYEKSKFGKPHPQKGHKLSSQTKIKIGRANSGKKRTKRQRKAIGVRSKQHIENCDGSCGGAWCGNQKYTETKPHKKLFEFLISAGYCVIKEKRFGRFSIDCYVPELNIGFEADGDYWHSHPERIKADKVRDEKILKRFEVSIIRLSESEIMSWK